MAKERRLVIHEMGLMRIRCGWPEMIKDDCDYFNIPYNLLAEESKISTTRIDYMCSGIAVYESKLERMNELTRLTLAFNRIIDKRLKGVKRSDEFSY